MHALRHAHSVPNSHSLLQLEPSATGSLAAVDSASILLVTSGSASLESGVCSYMLFLFCFLFLTSRRTQGRTLALTAGSTLFAGAGAGESNVWLSSPSCITTLLYRSTRLRGWLGGVPGIQGLLLSATFLQTSHHPHNHTPTTTRHQNRLVLRLSAICFQAGSLSNASLFMPNTCSNSAALK